MPFPDSQREQYDKNPLVEVICQLRFPPILRVDTEVPAAFQEHIRQQYPLFREKPRVDFGQALPPEIAQAVAANLSLPISNRAYEFMSADNLWTVTLTRDFLALTARKYEHWEDFKVRLKTSLDVFVEEYRPAFFSRIGLRYQDAIRKSELGLESVQWHELLKPHIVGLLSTPDIAVSIEETFSRDVVRLEDSGGRVHIQHGLAQIAESGEPCYLIDSDFFTETRTEIKDAIQVLDAFNREAGRLFRWCITERLRRAMGPHPVE